MASMIWQKPIFFLVFTLTPFPVSPKGRPERYEIAQWAILAKGPVCREGFSSLVWGKVGKGVIIIIEKLSEARKASFFLN
jgi:hypothetical protein